MTQVMAPPCERCGGMLPPHALVCTRCGALAHRAELERLSQEAVALEPYDPAAAAVRWRRCLDLLPPDAPQYGAIYQRLAAITAGAGLHPGYAGHAGYAGYPAPADPGLHPPLTPPPPDTLGTALLKTGGSMLISILVYALLFSRGGSLLLGLVFATGFVVLILIHELGHVAAMRYYGLSASPPIFIPFLGALINLRQPPQNAKVEAVVGIGGPIAGTVAALAVYALYLQLPDGSGLAKLTKLLAYVGFLLNLFNLLPVPPLDGGRITAAVNPKVWMLGIAGLIGLAVQALLTGNSWQFSILLMVLLFAYPRVRFTLSRRKNDDPYYAISRRASWTIGLLYVALGALLIVMWQLTNDALTMS